jgi:septal ring factor EnvC (AmiA/AmiB activator)
MDLGDEILNMSSTSFSLGMSQDLIDGLDMQSDFMSNDGSQQNQVQNLLVAEIKTRDKKIATLTADKNKLKNLLRKAKTTIDDVNTKFKASVDKIRTLQ